MRVRLFLLLLILFAPWCVRADTAVALSQSFAGNINFTGTQKTMRTADNNTNPCSVAGVNTDVSAVLTGIPSGATVVSAQLYWAASGSTQTSTVYMDGVAVTASSSRRY